MSEMFVKSGGTFSIKPGTTIVRLEELQELYEANELLKKAQAEIAALKQKTEEDYKKRYEEGYALGQEEGRGEYTMKIMEMVMTQVDSLEGLEQQLADVVIQSVEKMLGAFDPGDLAIRVVRQTLAAVRGEKRILVRVSMADEPYVRQDLQPYLISADGRTGYLELLGDPNLRHGDCILETPMGVVDGSLSSQLKILSKALHERVGAEN